jgi:hypothetical protein
VRKEIHQQPESKTTSGMPQVRQYRLGGAVMGRFECLYTKTQLQRLYASWGVLAAVPTKQKPVTFVMPNAEYFKHGRVTWESATSPDKQRLYRVVLTPEVD